ncbi:hypothetical protein CDL12_12567 [Handroanthus impetiginosus]|uniref:BHLH domain-containing protein n=1 Tax=Handroanthus impetiginosus TaxID=429701 RepID=A0A2G9HBE7_9LAMI|nr:hypothetical protein CDL12_12567 [Handroanthus impetiginosus]
MGKTRLNSAYSSKVRSGTAPRIERKIIEKNRRQRMKILYSNLVSLLPDHTSKVEGLPLPDQIDEAVEYIKSFKKKLEKMKQKKESLILQRKRSQYSYGRTSQENNQATNHKRSPIVEIHEMGPNFDLILANGLQDYSKFYDIIRLLHQHGIEIAGATFSGEGTSTIQVLQDKDGKSKLEFGGAAILSRKLKELVCGTFSNEVVESQMNLWDYEIESDIWASEIPAGFQYYCQEFYT